MKTKDIRILVTEEFKKDVLEVSEKDNKTMTGYITDLILEDFKRRGLRHGESTSK